MYRVGGGLDARWSCECEVAAEEPADDRGAPTGQTPGDASRALAAESRDERDCIARHCSGVCRSMDDPDPAATRVDCRPIRRAGDCGRDGGKDAEPDKRRR